MTNALSLFILLLSSTVYGQISANDSQIKDVAYAEDCNGIYYGNEMSFTTPQ